MIEWENIDITNDFMFSKVMRNETICKMVIELLLDINVKKIKYIEQQKVIDLNINKKSVRLDVYVEDNNKIYNIEMQTTNKKDLAKRTRYYQGMIDLNAIEKGAYYNELKESYIIFICTFDPFKKGLSKYTFENICLQDKSLFLNDKTQKIFFNVKAYEKEANKKIKDFLQYINGNFKNSNHNLLKLIDEEIQKVKMNKDWRIEFMTLYMKELEARQEGIEIGKKIGKQIGINEGKQIGINEGKQIGINEGKQIGILIERNNSIINTIKTLKNCNIDDYTIISNLCSVFNLNEQEANDFLLKYKNSNLEV